MTRQWPKWINRLDALLNYGKPLILVISGLPGIGSTSLPTWLAGGAVLGALAFVFQGLLRDFVAGLVVLLEDHYAVATLWMWMAWGARWRTWACWSHRCDALISEWW